MRELADTPRNEDDGDDSRTTVPPPNEPDEPVAGVDDDSGSVDGVQPGSGRRDPYEPA